MSCCSVLDPGSCLPRDLLHDATDLLHARLANLPSRSRGRAQASPRNCELANSYLQALYTKLLGELVALVVVFFAVLLCSGLATPELLPARATACVKLAKHAIPPCRVATGAHLDSCSAHHCETAPCLIELKGMTLFAPRRAHLCAVRGPRNSCVAQGP